MRLPLCFCLKEKLNKSPNKAYFPVSFFFFLPSPSFLFYYLLVESVQHTANTQLATSRQLNSNEGCDGAEHAKILDGAIERCDGKAQPEGCSKR